MNNPKKQHFVPEVYLQRFAFNKQGDLFCCQIGDNISHPTINIKNKSQIGYRLDGYTFANVENVLGDEISDTYIIEKKAFGYENALEHIFSKICTASSQVTKTEFRDFCKILLSIKRRNPVFSNSFSRENIKGIFKKEEDGLDSMFAEKLGNSEQVNQIVKLAKGQFLENTQTDGFNEDLYRHTLYRNELTLKYSSNTYKKLADCAITLHITSMDCPFISSDNPGFTLNLSNSKIYNLNFDFVDRFYFPLSPLHMIEFDINTDSSEQTIYKQIDYAKMDRNNVFLINSGTIQNAYRRVIGNFEDQLSITIQDFKHKDKNAT